MDIKHGLQRIAKFNTNTNMPWYICVCDAVMRTYQYKLAQMFTVFCMPDIFSLAKSRPFRLIAWSKYNVNRIITCITIATKRFLWILVRAFRRLLSIFFEEKLKNWNGLLDELMTFLTLNFYFVKIGKKHLLDKQNNWFSRFRFLNTIIFILMKINGRMFFFFTESFSMD